MTVATILLLASTLPLNSCIGSFALTQKVLKWNNQVGEKFVNALVFFAFWVLPVYEVSIVADALVINSIEFWSGNNPIEASVRTVETEQGKYIIDCDGKGYTVSCPNGDKMRLDFDVDTQTWAINDNGTLYPFMTMVDEEHVKMITPQGDFRMVDLNENGLQAYREIVGMPMMAAR